MRKSSISCAPRCAVLGIELQLPDPVKPSDLAAIAPRVRDAESRPFIESLIVRSMAQALYQPETDRPLRAGAEGLRAFYFADTPLSGPDDSPCAARPPGAAGPRLVAGAQELAAHGVDLSRLERRSDEADRYVGTFLKCVYLRDRVGQTFDGLITTVMEFGCFVQLLALGVDGLLPLASLRDDNYQMARDGGQWIGERSKRRLAPGVRLRVIVAAVKPVEGLIDLELAAD